MSDESKKPDEDLSEVERQTIKEVIAERHRRLELERQEAERAKRKRGRDERAKKREEEQKDEARRLQAAKVKAFHDSREQMNGRLQQASRVLKAALTDIQSVSFPRHSPQGQEQKRVVRSLNTALGALRSARRGTFYGTDLDEDVDLDVAVG